MRFLVHIKKHHLQILIEKAYQMCIRDRGYSWIDTLKAVTAAAVSDEQMAHAAERFPVHTPQNKEEYYYCLLYTS